MDFERLFLESAGQPIQYKGRVLKMIDKVSLGADKVNLAIEFISTASDWKQGIVFQTKGEFEMNGQVILNKIVIWEHTAPKRFQINVRSKDKLLLVYNVWETEDEVTHCWHSNAAFYTERIETSILYYCNDGYADEDFNDLIFRIQF